MDIFLRNRSVGAGRYRGTRALQHILYGDSFQKLAECEKEFKDIAVRLKVQLVGMGIGPDHVHIFVAGWKNYSIAQLVQRFKGASSRHIMEKYSVGLAVQGLYGDELWSDGHFHRTVGAVSTETMKRYVTESQQKHWTAKKPRQVQTTLLQSS